MSRAFKVLPNWWQNSLNSIIWKWRQHGRGEKSSIIREIRKASYNFQSRRLCCFRALREEISILKPEMGITRNKVVKVSLRFAPSGSLRVNRDFWRFESKISSRFLLQMLQLKSLWSINPQSRCNFTTASGFTHSHHHHHHNVMSPAPLNCNIPNCSGFVPTNDTSDWLSNPQHVHLGWRCGWTIHKCFPPPSHPHVTSKPSTQTTPSLN